MEKDKIIESFINLVKMDSTYGNEEKITLFLKNELENLGLTVIKDKAGNLIGKLEGELKNAPTLLLCAHMDTVEPGKGIKPVIEAGLVRSEGDTILGADNKAGINAILEGLKEIKTQAIPHGNIEVLLTVMEEVGLTGSKGLEEKYISSPFGYVFDSDGPIGTIVTKGPYHNKLKIYVKGTAAHAGVSPEEGVNAIQAASKALAKLTLGRIDEETTCNIGIISGGKAINIIPDSVYLEGEIRSLKEEKMVQGMDEIEKVFKEECELLGARMEFEVEELYPGMDIDLGDASIKLVSNAITAMGLIPNTTSTGGGSDANILNNKGITTINLGIGFNKPHSIEESIKVEDLILSVELVVNIIKEAAKV